MADRSGFGGPSPGQVIAIAAVCILSTGVGAFFFAGTVAERDPQPVGTLTQQEVQEAFEHAFEGLPPEGSPRETQADRHARRVLEEAQQEIAHSAPEQAPRTTVVVTSPPPPPTSAPPTTTTQPPPPTTRPPRPSVDEITDRILDNILGS